jgi:hypothetical protein
MLTDWLHTTPTRAQVTPDLSLTDLRGVKAAWIQAARDLDYPKMAWEIVRNLGRLTKFGILREAWFWKSGSISLIGSETGVLFSEMHAAYITRRAVSAYVAHEGIQTHLAFNNPVDLVIMGGHLVMHWAWLMADTQDGPVTEEDEGEKKDKLLFIPGQWTNTLIEAQPQAETAIKNAAREKTECERQKLLAQLLVGKEV